VDQRKHCCTLVAEQAKLVVRLWFGNSSALLDRAGTFGLALGLALDVLEHS
jgi:hypothetical protein